MMGYLTIYLKCLVGERKKEKQDVRKKEVKKVKEQPVKRDNIKYI